MDEYVGFVTNYDIFMKWIGGYSFLSVKDNLFSDTIKGKTFSKGNLRHREEFVNGNKDKFCLSWQYLPVAHGGVCVPADGRAGRAGRTVRRGIGGYDG
jgi:hypothetical protein